MFVSFCLLFCIFSFVCRTQSYLYHLSVPTSVILPVLVGIHSAGSNLSLCTITFANVLIQNFMPMSMLKMSTVLANALNHFLFLHTVQNHSYIASG